MPRLCKACGKDGVKKGCRYHPSCRPGLPYIYKPCLDCGKIRKVWPKRNYERCNECSYKCRSGAKNPNWRGGITPANFKIRASPEYKAWRVSVFKRDNYTCVMCGQVGGKLHADHILPFSTHPDSRFDVGNGRTLCVPCHATTPSFLGGARRLASAALNKLRDQCLAALSRETDVIVMSNHLYNGSYGIIGALAPSGRFLSLEATLASPYVKQVRFNDTVHVHGGFAAVVRSVEELHAAIERARQGLDQ